MQPALIVLNPGCPKKEKLKKYPIVNVITGKLYGKGFNTDTENSKINIKKFLLLVVVQLFIDRRLKRLIKRPKTTSPIPNLKFWLNIGDKNIQLEDRKKVPSQKKFNISSLF
jgi:hypothetical protein